MDTEVNKNLHNFDNMAEYPEVIGKTVILRNVDRPPPINLPYGKIVRKKVSMALKKTFNTLNFI